MEYPEVNPSEVIIFGWSSKRVGGWSMEVPNGIKVIHIPSGKEFKCESEKSQHKNRHIALLELSNYLISVKKRDDNDL